MVLCPVNVKIMSASMNNTRKCDVPNPSSRRALWSRLCFYRRGCPAKFFVISHCPCCRDTARICRTRPVVPCQADKPFPYSLSLAGNLSARPRTHDSRFFNRSPILLPAVLAFCARDDTSARTIGAHQRGGCPQMVSSNGGAAVCTRLQSLSYAIAVALLLLAECTLRRQVS